MKKLLLLFSLIFCVSVNAQISVVKTEKPIMIGKIAPMGQLNISIEKYESDNEYLITYRDVKFTKIIEYKSFTFKDKDNAFENLYQLIIDGLQNLPEENITLDLPNDIVYLKFEKFLGTPVVSFYTAVNKSDVIGVSGQYTKKQIDKIFGKSK